MLMLCYGQGEYQMTEKRLKVAVVDTEGARSRYLYFNRKNSIFLAVGVGLISVLTIAYQLIKASQ